MNKSKIGTRFKMIRSVPELTEEDISALFGFPHVVKNVDLFWGHSECVQYLTGLLVDKRGGRKGFPTCVVFAIQKLIEAHNRIYPQCAPKIQQTPFTCGGKE